MICTLYKHTVRIEKNVKNHYSFLSILVEKNEQFTLQSGWPITMICF